MTNAATSKQLEAIARKIEALRKQARKLMLGMPAAATNSDEQNLAWDAVRIACGNLGSACLGFDEAAKELDAHDKHASSVARARRIHG
jgi:hypothetical protein